MAARLLDTDTTAISATKMTAQSRPIEIESWLTTDIRLNEIMARLLNDRAGRMPLPVESSCLDYGTMAEN